MNKGGYVYIVSNVYRTTFYIGVTSNLSRRAWEHKSGNGSVFTRKYNCNDLVYYAFFGRITEAIDREKQLKKWKRSWKIELIKDFNPDMKDLYEEVTDMV